jgi:thymidine phosphorylase
MVPADKALYALRDVTATVPSIPLITASILSKKLTEGIEALVLDVKFGGAAFMQTREHARHLAAAMVTLGNECGVNTRALLSDMNTPLGRAAGNWLEVKESVACLEGRGPDDLRQLVIDCAAHLLVQTRRAAALEEGRAQAVTCLRSGEPRRKWDTMLAAQGADLAACERQLALDHTARVVREVRSDRSGFVSRCDARHIGEVIRELGGGRLTKDAVVDPSAGVDELAKPGQSVRRGDLLARVHAGAEEQADAAVVRLGSAFTLADEPPAVGPLVPEVLSS